MAGTGATAACAGTGADRAAAAPAGGGREQGWRQELDGGSDRSLPDLCGSSDDESDGGEVDFDELIGSSEPGQPLRGTSSTEWVSGVHN